MAEALHVTEEYGRNAEVAGPGGSRGFRIGLASAVRAELHPGPDFLLAGGTRLVKRLPTPRTEAGAGRCLGSAIWTANHGFII